MTTILIAFCVTIFDQLVKWFVVNHMELGETIPVIRNVFHFTYILNPGAAFGLLPHQDWFFLAIVVALFAAFFVMRKRMPFFAIASRSFASSFSSFGEGFTFTRSSRSSTVTKRIVESEYISGLIPLRTSA